jgi:hypothetical protein
MDTQQIACHGESTWNPIRLQLLQGLTLVLPAIDTNLFMSVYFTGCKKG